MIIDTINNSSTYTCIHPGFSHVFDFLKTHDLNKLSIGKQIIIENKLFVNIDSASGKGFSGAKLETHRKFIDIQYAISGKDVIGWKPLSECTTPIGEFNNQNDILFYSDYPTTWLNLVPDYIAIFFPNDAHAPLAGNGELKKLIFKVAFEW